MKDKRAKQHFHKNNVNIDMELQDKVFADDQIILPPVIDEMGRTRVQIGDKNPGSPVGPYYQIKNEMVSSGDPGYTNRLLVGTPTTGNIRMEWALARYGQIIPTNWSMVNMIQYMSTYAPIDYLVADAQNVIVKEFIEKGFEWLFLLEHDVILPADAFVRLGAYMRSEKEPVVSGLYFTKSVPAEPMIYRGRGNSYYTKWKFGDRVYCDGVPTGCLLIHRSILEAVWNESDEYEIMGVKTRRVFDTPRDMWFDPVTGQWNSTTGTSDLDWCTKVMKNKIFKKAGWEEKAKQRYPFLIDTNIYCKQIDDYGVTYPIQ